MTIGFSRVSAASRLEGEFQFPAIMRLDAHHPESQRVIAALHQIPRGYA
jgi:hypothetical protein